MSVFVQLTVYVCVFQLFTSGQVHYYGQAIGLILAEDQHTAWRAAALVKVTYTDVQPPVLTIKEVLQKRGQSVTTSSHSSTSKDGTTPATSLRKPSE